MKHDRQQIRHGLWTLGWLWIGLTNLPNAAFSMAVPAEIIGSNLLTGEKVTSTIRSAEKGTVVVFLSARCPCSASHEQKLIELYSKFAPRGFQFVGVHSNADESVEFSKQHFSGSFLPFPVIQDPRAVIADEMGALKTPHAFVISPKGVVLFQGGIDDSHIAQVSKKQYLEEALSSISEGKDPPRKEVRSLGCVIKRP